MFPKLYDTLSGGDEQKRSDRALRTSSPLEWPSLREQEAYWIRQMGDTKALRIDNNLAKPGQFDQSDVTDRALAEGDRIPSDGVAPVRGTPPYQRRWYP